MALSTTQYGYIIDPMVPFTDGKGKTIKDGFVRVFVAGSSTPVITYRNFDGATNQDRIELDNSGRTKTSVIGSKGFTYKVCVYDKHHSQESPILTVDKVSAIGANITAGSGATVVTGLDGLTTKPDGFVDASVIGTDGYVALDHTLVTDDLNTDAKATAVENDRYIPLLNDDVNDPDSKITLGRLWQWVLGKIKSLSTTITAFRTGDVIPVDGPDGTAKMTANNLLEITKQVAVDKLGPSVDKNTIVDYGSVGNSGITILSGKYIYYGDGTMIDDADSHYTDYVEVGNFDKFYVTAHAKYRTCGWAVYDSNKNFLVAGGYNVDESSYDAKDEIVDIGIILTTYPSAKYIRFSSIYTDLVINKFISYSANEAYGVLNQKITHSTIAKYGDIKSSNIPILTGKYIYRVDGTMIDEPSSYYTDYVSIDASDKFYVTGYAEYNTCGWAVYDSAKTFLASGGYNTDSPGARYFIRNELVDVSVILASYPKAKYIRFSSHFYSLVINKFYPYSADDAFEVHETKIENNTITKYGDIKDSGTPILSGKYVYRVDGTLVDSASSYYTDYVKISSNDKYYIKEIARWDTCGWAVYDDFKLFLGAGGFNTDNPNTRYVADNELVDISAILETYHNAKYIRFCSLESYLVVNKFYPYSADDAFENQTQLDTLYGKKWVACGDSFTHGDFTNYSSSDQYLDEGKYAGKYCVYPYIIGNRHNMDVLNIAVNGSTISQNGSSTSSSCFTYPSTGKLYTAIPADADIITLWFGINDSFSGVQLGTIDDATNDTFYGAWNVAIDYITQNYPFAKVGIFISNACRDAVWPAAVENIAKKWGIPYLDIDAGRPLMITASSRNPASAAIKNRVNELQRCAVNNNHPNPSAHKFQSLFIEAWLKTL